MHRCLIYLLFIAVGNAAEPTKDSNTPAPVQKPFFDPTAPAPTVDPTLPTPEPTLPVPEKKEKKKPVVPERKKKKDKN